MIIALYSCLILFIIVFELTRQRDIPFDGLSYNNLFFLMFFPISGISIEFSSLFQYGIEERNAFVFTQGIETPISVILGFLCLTAGFYNPLIQNSGKGIRFIPRQPKPKLLVALGLAMVAFAGVSFLLYSIPFGGPFATMMKGELIRTGREEKHAYAFLFRFAVLISIFIPFFTALLLSKRQSGLHYGILALCFLLTVAVFLPIAITYSGRAFLVMPFVISYIMVVVYTKRFYLPLLILSVAAMFVVLTFTNPLFSAIPELANGIDAFISALGDRFAASNNDQETVALSNFAKFMLQIEAFLAKFKYNIFSTQIAHEVTGLNPSGWVLWRDIPGALFALIPERLTGFYPPFAQYNISLINTVNIFPGVPYEQLPTSIPPGWIGSSIYTAWWFGVVINGFMLGAIGRIFHNIAMANWNNGFLIPYFYVIVMTKWSMGFQGLHWFKFISGNIMLFIWLTTLVCLCYRVRTAPAMPVIYRPAVFDR